MIIREVKNHDFPKLIWKGLEEWEEIIQKDFTEREARNLIWLIAEREGEVIGQVIAELKDKFNKPNLFALRVKEDHQRKGIGTKLIKHAEDELVKLGATIVTLSVDVGNEALELYERLGYKREKNIREEKWIRNYKGNVIEEIIQLIDLKKELQN